MGKPADWGRRRRLMDGLERIHLARPALRAYELAQALRAGRGPSQDDGLAIPPARLRAQLASMALDTEMFLRSGEDHAELVRGLVREDGRPIETMDAFLDWGCGCGRVLRHWRDISQTVQVHGCDINARAVEWCRSNLRFAEVSINDISPPFPYPDSHFDLVYALSVMTHLPEDLQRAWMDDCRRVLKPGGYLLFTTLGERYVSLDRLNDDERRAFGAGKLVVLYQSVAGTNLCSAYHPPAYVKEEIGADFELRAFVSGDDGFPQDRYLFRAA